MSSPEKNVSELGSVGWCYVFANGDEGDYVATFNEKQHQLRRDVNALFVSVVVWRVSDWQDQGVFAVLASGGAGQRDPTDPGQGGRSAERSVTVSGPWGWIWASSWHRHPCITGFSWSLSVSGSSWHKGVRLSVHINEIFWKKRNICVLLWETHPYIIRDLLTGGHIHNWVLLIQASLCLMVLLTLIHKIM